MADIGDELAKDNIKGWASQLSVEYMGKKTESLYACIIRRFLKKDVKFPWIEATFRDHFAEEKKPSDKLKKPRLKTKVALS